ncbi:gluconate 2-dehydrogenase subunit 3 family protein [Bradyrhizobium sp. SYSU BS000235]|uniref:gluconate 2-dehydrogenase subunit 3 family protein n=1 Tax=Bradyrhizobium sp. SYSU BS000235 TaxID=3411332 RepID=UPI003C72208D
MTIKRREFVVGAGVLGVASVTGGSIAPQPASAQHAMPMGKKEAAQASPSAQTATSAQPQKRTYTFLNPDEAAWVEAAVNHMIPADELTAGGVDLGVAYFIDQQLAGGFGQGGKMFMQGPWHPGTPQQGWQVRLPPAEAYRAAIPAINAYCTKTYGKDFASITEDQRDEVLNGLSTDKVDSGPLPAGLFLDLLYQNVMEGFFSDPAYGGNRDKAAWKMIGYSGATGNFVDLIETTYNKPYTEEPQSIADLS